MPSASASTSTSRRSPKRSPKRSPTKKLRCKRGQIVRAGYYRKAYTRVDGTRVRGVYVPAKCIKDRGLPGKGKKLFTVTRGALTEYGYSTKLSRDKRHRALSRAARALGRTDVIRKLNAVAVLNRNTNPTVARKFREDMKWVQTNVPTARSSRR